MDIYYHLLPAGTSRCMLAVSPSKLKSAQSVSSSTSNMAWIPHPLSAPLNFSLQYFAIFLQPPPPTTTTQLFSKTPVIFLTTLNPRPLSLDPNLQTLTPKTSSGPTVGLLGEKLLFAGENKFNGTDSSPPSRTGRARSTSRHLSEPLLLLERESGVIHELGFQVSPAPVPWASACNTTRGVA